MYTNELLSGLWIGDTDILNSKKFMSDNHIDIILNCTQLFDFPDLDCLFLGSITRAIKGKKYLANSDKSL